jgi:GNAT superfamily N-acetyltransferase
MNTPNPDAISIRPEPITSRVSEQLIAQLNAELLEQYPEPGATHFRLDADEVTPGQGTFLVAYRANEAVGCGALRRLDHAVGELKRMYVAPDARGQGLGRQLLVALEAEASRLGLSRLVLETGARQTAAVALYERVGYTVIPRFGAYVSSPFSLCMAKDL